MAETTLTAAEFTRRLQTFQSDDELRKIQRYFKSDYGNDHFIGMDFKDPALDWVGLANSMGMNAVRVTEPGELADVLKATYSRASGPALIDVVVDGVV